MRIVYVHGAGRQENRQLLKRRLDGHLFGSNQLERTALAYYSDILHDEPELPDDFESAPDPEAAAIAIAFQRHAMAVSKAQPKVKVEGVTGTEELPDPAFFLLARLASRDVTDYLLGGRAEAMRAPVRDALLASDQPTVVIAHSLGTIVTFDVLSELAGDAPEVPLLLTLGSPLGISNVLAKLVGGTPPPPSRPARVARWENVADPFDPVAVVAELSPLFGPLGSIGDHRVNNRSLLNHDLTGYLDTDRVRSLVEDAVRPAVPG
jgi:hypothetical protein